MGQYIIKGETLTAIADSIRAKTGSSDPIQVSDMADQIEAISGGGGEGVPEGYVTVTFMNGGVELFSRLVMVGDDCPDPWVQERIDTPTKESTAQYDYTFNGWATADGGSAYSNALKGITEDKVLYAAYASAVRYYTISFYDGDTLLMTKQVAYGSKPSVENPEKDGQSFDGWEPELATVRGETAYYAKWIEAVTFAGGSWADIARIAESGQASTHFALGDTRAVKFGNSTVTVKIVAFDHDDLADGTGKAGITVVCTDLDRNRKQVHSAATMGLGYPDTDMASYLEAKLGNASAEMQAVVKSVKKKYNSTRSSAVQTCDCKIWALSIGEAGVTSGNTETFLVDYGEQPYPGFDPALGKSTELAYWVRNSSYNTGTTQRDYWLRVISKPSSASVKMAAGTPVGGNWTPTPYMLYGFCI